MTTSTDDVQSSVNYGLMRRLLAFLAPYRWHLAVAIVLTLSSSALGPLRPYLTRIAIDDHIVTGDLDGLWQYVALIVGFLLLQGALQYGLSYLMEWIGQRVLLSIRSRLYDHVQRLALRYYDTTPVGRIITRVTNDVEVLNELFSSGVVMMISDIMIIFWILFFMMQTSVHLTLLTITILPLLLIASFVFRAKVRLVYNEIRKQVAAMNAFMNEFVSGISIVQLFTQQKRMQTQFAAINHEHQLLQDRSIFYYATFFPVVEFLSAIALSIILWFTANSIGSGTMTVGMLIAFAQFTEMFFRPVRDLTEKYNTLQSSAVASQRIFRLLDTKQTIDDLPGATPFPGVSSSIEFRDVHFSYDGQQPVLQGVSFHVEKGQTIALVGATGAGKSSIINVLGRFYDYQQGEVLVNGRDIRSYQQDTIRARMAMVLQDVFLFSRSIEENITLGRPGITHQDVVDAAVALGAHDFIMKLPNGYQTQVRERGAVLSTGQKQLISFCRALVGNPDILILDEATANIDTETELLIERSISTLLSGRTSIVIAHRLSTIQRADRIIVLHHGRVAEHGTHQELLAHGGLYHTLHQLQYRQPVS